MPCRATQDRLNWPSPTSGQTPAPSHLQHCSLPGHDSAQPPAGQHQPWKPLGPSPSGQQANTSFRTPPPLQPAVSKTSPSHQGPTPARGSLSPAARHQPLALLVSGLTLVLDPNPTHQWASTHPGPLRILQTASSWPSPAT